MTKNFEVIKNTKHKTSTKILLLNHSIDFINCILYFLNTKIKSWYPNHCPCRLCKTFFAQLGFIWSAYIHLFMAESGYILVTIVYLQYDVLMMPLLILLLKLLFFICTCLIYILICLFTYIIDLSSSYYYYFWRWL